MSGDHDDLEGRIRRLEDRSELWELAARYAAAVDDGDYGVLAGCFAKDAEFEGLNGSVNKGRDGIVEYLNGRATTAHSARVHTPTSQVLDTHEADRATGTVHCYAALFAGGPDDRFFAFRYEDRYVREDGRWLFERRRVHHVVDLPRS